MQKLDLKTEDIAYKLRRLILIMTTNTGFGNFSSIFSCIDIIAVLYNEFIKSNKDYFILSKKEALPVLYVLYNLLGEISNKQLINFDKINFSEFINNNLLTKTNITACVLGNGLGVGLGLAIKSNYKTYVLLDGNELNEGSNWEAIKLVNYYNIKNLIIIIDCNNLGLQDLEKLAKQLESFGLQANIIDGHDLKSLRKVFKNKSEEPYVIIAKTKKAHGIKYFDNKLDCFERIIPFKDLNNVLEDLSVNYNQLVMPVDIKNYLKKYQKENSYLFFENKKLLSTLQACNEALVNLGSKKNNLYCLSTEIKDFSFNNKFKENFPERFIECFTAEQNMINMSTGLINNKKIVFNYLSTSALIKVFEQLKMAAIEKVSLKIFGISNGIFIDTNNLYQMGLEDIAIIKLLPDSIVLYPCDYNSTQALVSLMLDYNSGIGYLRATKEPLPKVYKKNAIFKIGGSSVLVDSEKPQALIITAGISIHFALEAIDKLKKKNIFINLIDAYSIKPLDIKTILDQFKKCNLHALIIEDNYEQGGLGEAVSKYLNTGKVIYKFVNNFPKSGSSDELLKGSKIDSECIIKSILELLEQN
jgi:transketolase